MKPPGTSPSVREQLTSLVTEGWRISKHSLTRKVGHGSRRQDLVGDLVITFRTSSSETDLNRSNLGTSKGAGRAKESVLVKESLILLILSEKKVTKRLVRSIWEVWEGSTFSGTECRTERRIYAKEVFKNYRPVSNLKFISNIHERVVAVQPQIHLDEAGNLMTTFQSAYRKHHSTESALLNNLNDFLNMAKTSVTTLTVLNLSANYWYHCLHYSPWQIQYLLWNQYTSTWPVQLIPVRKDTLSQGRYISLTSCWVLVGGRPGFCSWSISFFFSIQTRSLQSFILTLELITTMPHFCYYAMFLLLCWWYPVIHNTCSTPVS